MVQSINTNLTSLLVQRHLNQNQRAQDTALERLGSGLRINGARDNAAGFANTIQLDTTISSTFASVRNANDGISLLQTAEGTLGIITESLQRIRELALQAANGNNNEVDRQALDEEAQQLIKEVDSAASNANFNGQKLFDGSFNRHVFQTGVDLGEVIQLSIPNTTTASLGTSLTAGVSSTRGTRSIFPLTRGDVIINGIEIGDSLGVDDKLSTVNPEFSAIAKAAAINRATTLTNVTARVNANTVGYSGPVATNATVAATTININGVAINVSTNSAQSADVNRQGVVNAINGASGLTQVAAVDTGNTNTGISLVAADGRNIQYDDNFSGISAAVGVGNSGAAQVYSGTFTLVSQTGGLIELDQRFRDSHLITGLRSDTFSGSNSVALGRRVSSVVLAAGDLVINGVSVGGSSSLDDSASSTAKSASAIAKAAAINAVSDQTGVVARALPNVVIGYTITPGNTRQESVDINGVTVEVNFSAADTAEEIARKVVSSVNQHTGSTGVVAEFVVDPHFGAGSIGPSFRLEAADGRNIVFENQTANIAEAGFSIVEPPIPSVINNNNPHLSAIELVSAGRITLSSTTASGGIDNAGFSVGEFGDLTDSIPLKFASISTVAGANLVLTAVDNSLQRLAFQQAQVGALQNRFVANVDNLLSQRDNLTSAVSRIRDADFALETANLAKTQLLQQASISVLAQANLRSQQALKLLEF
ncbi:flagellin [Endozoicomonas sp. SM1973]|uniref:Flagellin n=1 Tax=Spartinivicinus marinus TaxID=2994442 RepID=A0A853IBR3_9GAMM|nr:flagellin [Spartinivicinus marinus]MCX4026343.1 flagellin [Spartinivicinus marinus]NYZ67311.1 flagellin [Spartinivicinus marinus]